MKNVKYINAGAGSGKTYTLTSELADLVSRGLAEPGQVIMTTFSERAAAEMRTKAKSMLLSRGLADAALQIDYALIGTIHSVAYQLIRKFWFFLGLPPELNVMDEEDQSAYVAQSVSDLPDDSELRFLHHFAREFNVSDGWGNVSYDFWMDDLKSIVALSTNYEISDFSASKSASVDFFRRVICLQDCTLPSEDVLSDALKRIIDTWEAYARNKKPNITNEKRIELAKSLLSQVKRRNVAWYVSFGSQCTGIRGAALDDDVIELIGRCANIYRSPMVFAEVEKYINLIFRLADRWRDNYAAFKAERNILDYDDMEKYLLRLLDTPEVIKEISASYKYLFVDEYQDCSPIQVKIFDRLSDVMAQSYWVGDSKQAIYAFRGSATELTRAVMSKIARHEDGCTTETLKYSWRSQPDIVNLCNKVFTQVYAHVYDGDMPIENIVLEPKRPLPGEEIKLPDLCYCDISECRGGEAKAHALAEQVAALVRAGLERPSDIAILCRRNADVAYVAAALRELGVPCNAASLFLPAYKATTLLLSLLALVISPRNMLAKATIAYLTEEGCDLSEIIERASYETRKADNDDDQEDGSLFNMSQLVMRASNLPAYMAQQSVGALVESIIIELRLFDEVKKFEDPVSQISCLNALIDEAYRFEERCSKNGRPASLSGFINYVNGSEVLCGGDPDGVQVLTYHKSKGLQWKRVFLCDMDNDSFDDQSKLIRNSVFGIHREYVSQPSADNLYPEVRIRVAPWIFGSKKKLSDDLAADIAGTPLFSVVRSNEVAQSANLLYVGMTRPQNCLTLVLSGSCNPLAWLSLLGVRGVGDDKSRLLGTDEVFCDCVQGSENWQEVSDLSGNDKEYRRALVANGPSSGRSLRDLQPSRIPGYALLGRVLPVSDRLRLLGDYEMDEVGNCIHQIFAYVDDYAPDRQLTFAQNVIDAYGLTESIPHPQSLLDTWAAVKRTLTDLYGPAECVYHERPFSLNRYGHLLNGSMDLVWHTPSGDVLVDFKTCPMGKDDVTNTESPHYAGIYAGQLDVYADALEAASAAVLSRWIFYPVIGLLVEVLDNQRPFFDDNMEMMIAETNSLTQSIIVDEFVFFGDVDFSKLRSEVPDLIDGVIGAIPLTLSDIFNNYEEDDILPDDPIDEEGEDYDDDDLSDDDLSDDDDDLDEDDEDDEDDEGADTSGMDNNIRLAIKGGSSQGIDMFSRDGAEIIRIPYVASEADIHLACVILRYVSQKYGLTIYCNKEPVDVNAPDFEKSIYENRRRNVRLLLNAESFEHLAINGINNTLNINLKDMRRDMPDATVWQMVDHVIARLIALQWDYLDYHGTWCFSLGEGGNRRVFVKIDNSENVIVPFCNTVILFLHATPVVISQKDFYALAVESPYVEAVDSLQLAMRQMPPNDWEDLWLAAAQKANFHPKTYLLRWNPDISSFSRDAYAGLTARNNDFAMDWSIHEWQDAKLGDFFFMVRVGKESEADGTAGVVFRGEIVTPPYLAPDWNEGKSSRPFRHYVDISCRHCAPVDGKPCISLAQLNEAIPEIDWGRGHSGVLLSPDAAARLAELWSKLNP